MRFRAKREVFTLENIEGLWGREIHNFISNWIKGPNRHTRPRI